MLPTILLLGVLAGVSTRAWRPWWSVAVLGVAWAAVIVLDMGFSVSLFAGALVLGAVNAAVGVLSGRMLGLIFHGLRRV